MTRAEWIAVAAIAFLIGLMITAAVRIKRKKAAWEWLHPPEEDDDGICILKEDDPDGENSR